MQPITGLQVLELLNSGEAVVSDDKKTINRKGSGEVLATRIATNDGRGYYKATSDGNISRDCISVCLRWQIDEKQNLEVCVKWGCEESNS